MAEERPAETPAEVTSTETVPTAETAPVVADPALAAPDSFPTAPAATAVEPVAAESFTPAPVVSPPVAPVSNPHQVVYVEAPQPFVKKGNRGFGILIAVLSTVIFAALYAVSELLTDLINKLPASFDFTGTLDFWTPVVFFAVGFIVLVLIVNRAGWAAHVVGSLFVGAFVYFGASLAFLALHASTIPSNLVGATYNRLLFSVGAILAALIAREVALWMGIVVAARGRRVKARNVDARVLYDQEIATKRAEYERANAAARVTASGPIAEPVDAPLETPVTETDESVEPIAP
jgi:hypothetical protein